MKRITFLLLVLLIFTSYCTIANEQDSIKTQPKNIIYVNAGTVIVYSAFSFNAERQLFATDKKYYINYYLKASAGGWAWWMQLGGGAYGSLSLQGVFGPKTSHLELGLGLGVLYDKQGYNYAVSDANYFREPLPSRGDFTTWAPAFSVGYRYQKPTGGFIYRVGAGFPDCIYISLGFAF